jgi:Flp pilus assembly protein TadG
MSKQNQIDATSSATQRRGRSFKELLRREGGSVAIYAALTLPVVAGIAGFGLDTSIWYAVKRDVQGMADAAAVAAAQTKMQGGSSAEVLTAATTEATRNGYDATACLDVSCLVLTEVNNDFGSDKTETVQVQIRQEAPMRFTGLFFDAVYVSSYASSGTQQLGAQCVLALNQTSKGAVTFSGNTTADVGCGVASNSNHEESILVSGSATLVANPVQAYGGIGVSGSGTITSDYPLLPFSRKVADPYASFVMPALHATCDYDSTTTPDPSVGSPESASFAVTDPDGTARICGDLDIQGDATFGPGIYMIDGDFDVGGMASLDATAGVTFILTADDPADTGSIWFVGGADIAINAPDSGPTEGMAIVQDPNAPNGGTNKILGGSDQIINGVIYFRNQKIEFTGGSDTVDSCVQIIGDEVEFIGDSVLENTSGVCENVGVNTNGTGGGLQVVLVR